MKRFSRHVPKAAEVLAALICFIFFPASAPSAAEVFNRETPVVQAVRLAGPAVVNISASTMVVRRGSPFSQGRGDDFFDSFFRDFFDQMRPREQTSTSLGSGVIIDGIKGFILTNEHVVAGASAIKVSLVDEQEYPAELVGSDPDSDLAVLQIKADRELPALQMGDSSDLMIGETVIAIGNPFGLTHTVTTGVVSAVNRSVRTDNRVFHNFIQTDASINPGNSGGPLLNINGSLIGINSAIYDRAEGIGFAIPINKAKRIIRDLISFGEVQTAWLGLSLQTLDARLAQHFQSPFDGGAVITDVDPDGPAARTDLARGDVVARLDRTKVLSVDDYEDLLRGYTAGEKISLTVYRQGKARELTIKAAVYPLEKAEKLSWERYGLAVAAKKSGPVEISGVRPDSPAARLGLKPGDIFHRINEIKTDSRESYLKALAKYRFRQGLSAVIQRGSYAYHITLTQ